MVKYCVSKWQPLMLFPNFHFCSTGQLFCSYSSSDQMISQLLRIFRAGINSYRLDICGNGALLPLHQLSGTACRRRCCLEQPVTGGAVGQPHHSQCSGITLSLLNCLSALVALGTLRHWHHFSVTRPWSFRTQCHDNWHLFVINIIIIIIIIIHPNTQKAQYSINQFKS